VTFTSVPGGATVPNSDLIGPNGTFTATLTIPGTYHYYDSLFSWMKGTIIVKSG
jgi:plastocyanin